MSAAKCCILDFFKTAQFHGYERIQLMQIIIPQVQRLVGTNATDPLLVAVKTTRFASSRCAWALSWLLS